MQTAGDGRENIAVEEMDMEKQLMKLQSCDENSRDRQRLLWSLTSQW